MYLIVPVVILAFLLISAVRILNEYERGVVFTLGRYTATRGPGIILVIPFVQRMVKMDLRTIVLDVPTQDVISRDNVSVKVNAVVYFRVVDPQKAIIAVENFLQATSQFAQTTLRAVLGFPAIRVLDVELLQRAVEVYEVHRLDFADAYLVASAERTGIGVIASFDRSIDRVGTVRREEPS